MKDKTNMARILFVFKNILFFFRSEKILSLFILSGMIVCDTIFLVFGNILWSDAKSNEYEIYKNNVVTLEIDASGIDRFLELTEGRDYITSAFFRYAEYDEENHPITISAYSPSFDPEGKRIRLGHGLTGDSGECMVSDGYLQRKSATLQGNAAGQALHSSTQAGAAGQAPHSALPGDIIGASLRFLGADWVCTGIIAPSMADDFDILIDMAALKTHIGNQEKQVTSGFRYENGVSLVEIRKFANQLKEEFHADFAAVPSRTAGVGFGEFLSDISEMLVLLVIAVINYMFLYRFLLEKRMYAYGIFKLHGMDDRLTLAGLCAEMLIFLTASFAFSLLLYLGGTALFGRLGMVMEHVPEFYFSFVIVSVINLLFFGLAAVKVIRSSPVELIRESAAG